MALRSRSISPGAKTPSSIVFVSWASPAQAVNPRVILRHPPSADKTIHAVQRTYTDGLNGQTVFTYHARLDGLKAGSTYHYAVTADNDRNRAQPFTATFQTAPRGRAPFRWTSYGDLATPITSWVLSSPQSRHAVRAVEQFQPLFHLLNGDLCYANLNPAAQPAVWADFGNNVQVSAANRPWMPCPGNHEIEFHNGAQGFNSYLTRYSLPHNGTQFPGLWYRFKVGSALFISLSADDVIYQDSGAFVAGPAPLQPAPSTGNAPIEPGTSLICSRLQRRRADALAGRNAGSGFAGLEIDWIIVQMHQDALSSSKNGNGSDKGIRETWLPLFDRYGVDLVLCGHDHDYERSWPVRGCNHNVGRDAATGATVDTCQPNPVMTAEPADGKFDTSRGTIHLILGGGGTSAPLDAYGVNSANGQPQAKVITKANRPVPGADRGHVHQGQRRRAGRRHLVGAPRHDHRLWHRRLRSRPRRRERQNIDHHSLLPRPRGRHATHLELRDFRNRGARQRAARFANLMQMRLSWGGDEVEKISHIDVASRNNRDNRTLPRLARQCRCKG